MAVLVVRPWNLIKLFTEIKFLIQGNRNTRWNVCVLRIFSYTLPLPSCGWNHNPHHGGGGVAIWQQLLLSRLMSLVRQNVLSCYWSERKLLTRERERKPKRKRATCSPRVTDSIQTTILTFLLWRFVRRKGQSPDLLNTAMACVCVCTSDKFYDLSASVQNCCNSQHTHTWEKILPQERGWIFLLRTGKWQQRGQTSTSDLIGRGVLNFKKESRKKWKQSETTLTTTSKLKC